MGGARAAAPTGLVTPFHREVTAVADFRLLAARWCRLMLDP